MPRNPRHWQPPTLDFKSAVCFFKKAFPELETRTGSANFCLFFLSYLILNI